MGLTTALYTSLSGLTVHSEAVTVAGDNIANVNTTGFKYSRADFQNQVLRNLRSASGPTETRGGTNPMQVGLGVSFGGISRVHTNGSIQTTGVDTELAIDGGGMFVLDFGNARRYTRAGNFKLDSNFNLVNPDGGLVQGFGVDNDFNVIPGSLGNINIPIGTSTLAEATQNVRFAGNLNAGGDIATQGSINTADAIYSDAGATTPAVAGDALTSLFDAAGNALFALGDVITVQDAQKGGSTLPAHSFEVGPTITGAADDAGTTFQDFMDFLEDVLGIDTSTSGGISIAGGQLTVTGNTGTANDVTLEGGNIIVNAGTPSPSLPFNFTRTQDADGESVRTSLFAFDTLGNELRFDLTAVLEQKSNTGTTWRYYVQSEDDSDLDRVISNGTMDFDNNGQIVSISNKAIQIDLNQTGAFTPQQISLNFDDPTSPISALSDSFSQLNAIGQDGSPIGTLESFSISEDGTILGVYSNGLLRNQGQVALATFANEQGLQASGGGLFNVTPNSGDAAIVAPGQGGTGRVIGGALELSNVELSQEFINLISASTGFSASSRVLTTSDEMIQELLATIR